MRKTLLALSLLSLLASAACRDAGIEVEIEKAGSASAPALTAKLAGKVTFEGTAPTPKKIPTSSQPGCKNSNLVSEEYVVSDGGLENVILYVSGGDIAGKTFPIPAEVVTLTQEGCRYVPHTLTLQVRQQLRVVNNDETAHNVHGWAEANKIFNDSQSSKGVENIYTFDKEEVLLPVRCDIHTWMNAFIGVFSHPLHTVSKKGGAYEMMLPAGSYKVTAAHETLGKQEMMVTVAENGTAELNFTFKSKDKPAN